MSDEVEVLKKLLPEIGTLPLSEWWMYTAIRHCERNMDIEYDDDGGEPDRQSGTAIAKVINLLPDIIAALTPTPIDASPAPETVDNEGGEDHMSEAAKMVVKPDGGGTGTGVEIPAGMKPWHGGDSAPEDWDRAKPVKTRSGISITPRAPFHWQWSFNTDNPYSGHDDIIAYTPRSTPSGSEGLEKDIRAALLFDTAGDASWNLQGALDDIRDRHKIDDGGVIERTIERVIGQIERARAALTDQPKTDREGA